MNLRNRQFEDGCGGAGRWLDDQVGWGDEAHGQPHLLAVALSAWEPHSGKMKVALSVQNEGKTGLRVLQGG